MRRIFDFFCVRRNFEEDNDTTTTRRRASFADALRSRFGRALVALRRASILAARRKKHGFLYTSRFFF